MSLPALPQVSEPEPRFASEVTRLNCDGQFKPFVYLNWPNGGPAYRRLPPPTLFRQEKSRLSAGLSCSHSNLRRTSDPPSGRDSVPDPDGSDPAAAGRA